MNKLFILSGASGAGKSTLLDRLVKDKLCDSIPKYSNRKKFNTVDDVVSIKSFEKMDCDIVYSMYGNLYGFNSKLIVEKIREKSQILITNDKKAIEKIKMILQENVVVIYVVSDINKEQLKKIYLDRYGYPSIKSIRNKVGVQLDKSKKMLLKDDTEGLVKCIDRVEQQIENILMCDEGFKLRYASIKQRINIYSTSLLMYDHVVLNFYSNGDSPMHATKSAYEQLKKIVMEETKGEADDQ